MGEPQRQGDSFEIPIFVVVTDDTITAKRPAVKPMAPKESASMLRYAVPLVPALVATLYFAVTYGLAPY